MLIALLLCSLLLIEASKFSGKGYKSVARDSISTSGPLASSADHKEEAHVQGTSNVAAEVVEDSRDESSYEVIKAAPQPAPATSKETKKAPVIETEVIVLGH